MSWKPASLPPFTWDTLNEAQPGRELDYFIARYFFKNTVVEVPLKDKKGYTHLKRRILPLKAAANSDVKTDDLLPAASFSRSGQESLILLHLLTGGSRSRPPLAAHFSLAGSQNQVLCNFGPNDSTQVIVGIITGKSFPVMQALAICLAALLFLLSLTSTDLPVDGITRP